MEWREREVKKLIGCARNQLEFDKEDTVDKADGIYDFYRYIQQLRDGIPNFFATFIEVLRDRPPGQDWELEPGVTCGDYLFGMLQVCWNHFQNFLRTYFLTLLC